MSVPRRGVLLEREGRIRPSAETPAALSGTRARRTGRGSDQPGTLNYHVASVLARAQHADCFYMTDGAIQQFEGFSVLVIQVGDHAGSTAFEHGLISYEAS